MDILSNFSESITDIIFDEKITIEEFAHRVGINLSEIYRYKRKESLPSSVNLVKIADTFNYSIDTLLGFADYSPSINYHKTGPFDTRFKEILQTNGITRYKLCKDTGLSPSRVDEWFHGKRFPSLNNLIILKDYFNCSIDNLLGRE